MIILLGGSGYVGNAFQFELQRRQLPFTTISRNYVNYYDESSLAKLLYDVRPTFLINAAGYTGKPNVESCETDKANCLLGNAVLPGIDRTACGRNNVPSGHVSSRQPSRTL